jgi:GntR family transcriptional regulator
MRRWEHVDQTLDRPVFKQIADQLRASIESGDLSPGGWLPSEAHLCAEFNAGRNSVRSAIRVLVGEGYLESHAGRGHRVRERSQQAIVKAGSGSRISTRMPTEAERRQFGISEGTPLLVVERDGVVDLYPGDRTVIEVDPTRPSRPEVS